MILIVTTCCFCSILKFKPNFHIFAKFKLSIFAQKGQEQYQRVEQLRQVRKRERAWKGVLQGDTWGAELKLSKCVHQYNESHAHSVNLAPPSLNLLQKNTPPPPSTVDNFFTLPSLPIEGAGGVKPGQIRRSYTGGK